LNPNVQCVQALAVYTTLLGTAVMPSEPVTGEISGLRLVVTTGY